MAGITTLGIEQEVISLEQAKQYLLVDFDHDDSQITRLIAGVRSELEAYLGRALTRQTLEYVDDLKTPYTATSWLLTSAGKIPLPRPPFVELVNVELEMKGVWTSIDLSTVTVDAGEPASIDVPGVGTYPFRIRYKAGYEAGLLPTHYLQAVYELLAYRYQNREGGPIPPSILNGLMGSRVWL